MVIKILMAMLVFSIVIPFGIYFLGERKQTSFKSVLAVNIVSFFGILIFTTVFMFSNTAIAGETAGEAAIAANTTASGMAYLAAALSTGLCTIGTGIATGQAAAAALGAISENEKIMGKALIFVALAEGIAIYGLLISFTILGNV